jgi:GT2 family glycosyltransferase
VARLEAEPDLDVVTGRIQYVDLPGAPPMNPHFEGRDKPVAYTNLGAALYRRRAFDRVGSFEERFRFGEDQDWFLRFKEAELRMVILPEVTLIYRRHAGNMTNVTSAKDLLLTGLIKRSLDRRRQAGGPVKNYSPWLSSDDRKDTDS